MVDISEAIKRKYRLGSIYFYPTGKCNLRCVHCWINPPFSPEPVLDKDELTLDEIKKMIDDGVSLGMGSIKLTGGEPFLRKDIIDIIGYIADKDISLVIETNGTLIDDKIADALSRAHKKKKLSISISLDGYNSGQHEAIRQVEGSFDAALRGIGILKSRGISPQMITVLYRNNKDDIEKITALAARLGVNSLKFNIMSFIARGEAMHKKGYALSVAEILEIRDIIKKQLLPRYRVNIIYDIPTPLGGIGIGAAAQKARRCRCNLFGILGVLSDGSVSLCGIGTSVKELVMGNVRSDSLRDIWENNPILESLRRDIPFAMEGICGRCIFKAVCLGKCRAEVYYKHKNFTAAFSLCQQAYEEGLFPEKYLLPKRDL